MPAKLVLAKAGSGHPVLYVFELFSGFPPEFIPAKAGTGMTKDATSIPSLRDGFSKRFGGEDRGTAL
jgi:hypothetical protein